MGEQEDDTTWVYGLSGICICIVFVMGMGVFSAVFYGIPGIQYIQFFTKNMIFSMQQTTEMQQLTQVKSISKSQQVLFHKTRLSNKIYKFLA